MRGYNFYSANHSDGKGQGGPGIFHPIHPIKNHIRHHGKDDLDKDWIQATSICLTDWGVPDVISALRDSLSRGVI